MGLEASCSKELEQIILMDPIVTGEGAKNVQKKNWWRTSKKNYWLLAKVFHSLDELSIMIDSHRMASTVIFNV